MKKTVFLISILFNFIIIIVFIYFFSSASFSASVDDDDIKTTSYDSINMVNKVKVVEISPKNYKIKVNELSKDKKCVVIFWASWCKYCPILIKIMNDLKANVDYDFNYFLVSIDKPNAKGKIAVMKKISNLELKNEQFITSINDYFDISNAEAIYKYLPENSKFDEKPGFPHILIYKNNQLIYEDTGYDNIYGISKYVDLLKKNNR